MIKDLLKWSDFRLAFHRLHDRPVTYLFRHLYSGCIIREWSEEVRFLFQLWIYYLFDEPRV